MNEMNYIYTMLNNHNYCLSKGADFIFSQKKINKAISWFAVATVAYILVNDGVCAKQEKRIKKLEQEIEELKSSKGE